jgi:acetolactate synthase-1/2/3 large subunit
MKVSDYIVEFLTQQGVHHIFYLIGGAITHLVDSSIDRKDFAPITMHHEQAAAFAAEAYARCNGKLGAAMATSGPGATNLITGIGSCFFDSVPCVFLTGQVNTYEYKFDQPVRQIGFQETDIVSIVNPITKGARLVTKPEDIRRDLEWAAHLAQSGRPGPVLLDIPMNIQRAEINPESLAAYVPPKEIDKPKISKDSMQKIIAYLQAAQRPVILVGGGIRTANASDQLLELVKKTNIPIVASLMGLDAFPHDNEAYVGMIGTYGNRSANFVIANADFLLILGSRLDTRQTGTKPQTFARAAKIVHIDIDQKELNRVIQGSYVLRVDLKDFLQAFNLYLHNTNVSASPEWLKYVKNCKQKYPSFNPNELTTEIDPNEFIYRLSQKSAENAIITVDVGQHQMWVAQSFMVKAKQRVLISGGMGAMGFALPAAIGAAFLDRNREIIVIVGDGGFQINMQELQTIVRNKLKIKIVLLNNNSLGMVRQFQEIYFNGRTEGTLKGYNNPDFIKIADAYGIKSIFVDNKNKIDEAIADFLKIDGSALIEVLLPQTTKVEPKLIVNDPIEDQDPKLDQTEFEKMMLISIVSR